MNIGVSVSGVLITIVSLVTGIALIGEEMDGVQIDETIVFSNNGQFVSAEANLTGKVSSRSLTTEDAKKVYAICQYKVRIDGVLSTKCKTAYKYLIGLAQAGTPLNMNTEAILLNMFRNKQCGNMSEISLDSIQECLNNELVKSY